MNFTWKYSRQKSLVWERESKFVYFEKATKFYEISTLLLSYVVPVKSKVEISQNFVAFSEYMNFTYVRNFKVDSGVWMYYRQIDLRPPDLFCITSLHQLLHFFDKR